MKEWRVVVEKECFVGVGLPAGEVRRGVEDATMVLPGPPRLFN
jgi:hypothetical protein